MNEDPDNQARQTPATLRQIAEHLRFAADDIESWAVAMESSKPPIREAYVGAWPTIKLAMKNAIGYANHVRKGVHDAKRKAGVFGEPVTPEESDTESDTNPVSNSVSKGKRRGKSDTKSKS